ncbi:hypothetical protein ZEAMMB73_Zm00001d022340, partial [Zea mays]
MEQEHLHLAMVHSLYSSLSQLDSTNGCSCCWMENDNPSLHHALFCLSKIFLFAPSGLNPYKCTWHWLPICRFITSHEKDTLFDNGTSICSLGNDQKVGGHRNTEN